MDYGCHYRVYGRRKYFVIHNPGSFKITTIYYLSAIYVKLSEFVSYQGLVTQGLFLCGAGWATAISVSDSVIIDIR